MRLIKFDGNECRYNRPLYINIKEIACIQGGADYAKYHNDTTTYRNDICEIHLKSVRQGRRHGTAGDLVIYLNVSPDEVYKRIKESTEA